MSHYHKPAHERGVGIVLVATEHRFEARGIHGGATLWADPDQGPAEQADLVLATVDGKHLVCQFNEVPAGCDVVGPIVWVEPASFVPRPSVETPAGASGADESSL